MISIFRLQARPTMAAKFIVEIVLINNLGFKVRMVYSGTKHAFKYEKRH